jgi:3'-5' exoribonuclease
MTIAKLDYRHKGPVSGEFRVRHPYKKNSDNGSLHLAFTIEDYSGQLKAYVWSKNVLEADELVDFDCITLNGQLREFNGSWIVDVVEAKLLQYEPDQPVRLIPRSITPLPSLLEQLDKLADYFSHGALRRFVGWVLADDAISFPFVSLPASRQHHHSIAGGLLEHSLECVAMVSRFEEFPQAEIELAMVGALFHDVGKIKTLQNVGKHTTAGHILDHDALTLEVLAPHLQRLDALCPDAGLALRYLWTWKMQRNGFRHPLLTIAEAISAADRISSGLNRQDTAFQEHPDWHTFARIGDNSTFWRPRLELQNASVM